MIQHRTQDQSVVGLTPQGAAPLLVIFAASLALVSSSSVSMIESWNIAVSICLLVQLAFILNRWVVIGWVEMAAYMFHWIFVGAASVVVSCTEILDIDSEFRHIVSMAALSGQFVLGHIVLHSSPVVIRAEFSRRMILVLMMLCGGAACAKFISYATEILNSGSGHLAIYLQGDLIRDSSPLLVKIFAAGVPIVAILCLLSKDIPTVVRLLAVSAIAMEFLIGTRSRPIFLIGTSIALLQLKFLESRRIRNYLLFGVIGGLALAVVVGYFREGYDIPVIAYVYIVLESLTGTYQASVDSIGISGAGQLVVSQVVALLFPTNNTEIDTVAKLISSTLIPGAYAQGFGLSSSVLLELAALCPLSALPLIYPVIAFALVRIVRNCLDSSSRIVFLIGVALAPTLFYLWRAEMAQPAVVLIKSLPFIVAINFFQDKSEEQLPPVCARRCGVM